jgi:hypothetical protein
LRLWKGCPPLVRNRLTRCTPVNTKRLVRRGANWPQRAPDESSLVLDGFPIVIVPGCLLYWISRGVFEKHGLLVCCRRCSCSTKQVGGLVYEPTVISSINPPGFGATERGSYCFERERGDCLKESIRRRSTQFLKLFSRQKNSVPNSAIVSGGEWAYKRC